MGKNNIMVDLETMGSGSNSAIISIGAVRFGDGKLQETFYTNINLQSCIDAGLQMDASTIMWWMKQSDSARKAFNSGVLLTEALTNFGTFILSKPNPEIWGNGVDFDNVLLANAYRVIKKQLPWKYWNNRCYRTIKGLNPHVGIDRAGTAHNALDDAKTQAEHLMKMLPDIGK